MAMNRKKTTIVKSKPTSGVGNKKTGGPTSLKPKVTMRKKKY